MQSTNHPQIRDPRAAAVIVSAWTLETPEDQVVAAEAALSAMSASPGLVRFSIFRGIEDLTLVPFSQWTDEAARDHYAKALAYGPRGKVDAKLPDIDRSWRDLSVPYRSFIAVGSGALGCLVVVRQPLKQPDTNLQRDWADTVITALESDAEPMPGLNAASFFLSADGSHVINLAEWTSADAHRKALDAGSSDKYGSFSQSPEWQATRSHPGITAEHDMRRYEFFGAVEPGKNDQ